MIIERSGTTQAATADAIGCGRPWLCKVCASPAIGISPTLYLKLLRHLRLADHRTLLADPASVQLAELVGRLDIAS